MSGAAGVTRYITMVDERDLERVAWIIGDSSAARAALNDAAKRRALGERVSIYRARKSNALLVGPTMPPERQP